jgi:hypothetical protein
MKDHEGRKTHLFHTDSVGKYWCGYTHSRTPLELLNECQSTIEDLVKNHPHLAAYIKK